LSTKCTENVRRNEREYSNYKTEFEQRSEHKLKLYQNGVQNHNDKQKIRRKGICTSAGFGLAEFDLLVKTILLRIGSSSMT
jgi:hypothetical protein